jgi:hypothetical protein
MLVERRRGRSEKVWRALELQLAASVGRARFDALVLAEEAGLVVAAAGTTANTDEIAALAPALIDGCELWHGTVETSGGSERMTIARIRAATGQLFLAALGGRNATIIEELRRSSDGVRRILD